MMVMCNDIVVIEHDKRRLELPSAPVVMEHDINRTEESTAIAQNIQHNPYIFTYPAWPKTSKAIRKFSNSEAPTSPEPSISTARKMRFACASHRKMSTLSSIFMKIGNSTYV